MKLLSISQKLTSRLTTYIKQIVDGHQRDMLSLVNFSNANFKIINSLQACIAADGSSLALPMMPVTTA